MGFTPAEILEGRRACQKSEKAKTNAKQLERRYRKSASAENKKPGNNRKVTLAKKIKLTGCNKSEGI
jgi:hypothetical protein